MGLPFPISLFPLHPYIWGPLCAVLRFCSVLAQDIRAHSTRSPHMLSRRPVPLPLALRSPTHLEFCYASFLVGVCTLCSLDNSKSWQELNSSSFSSSYFLQASGSQPPDSSKTLALTSIGMQNPRAFTSRRSPGVAETVLSLLPRASLKTLLAFIWFHCSIFLIRLPI